MQSDNGKLFVGGISWDTNEDRLKEYFSSYGEVVEAVIMKDRSTGRARGFGFVVFADPRFADIVIQEKHNIDGRMVEAKKAVPRDDPNVLSRNNGSSIQGSPGRTRKIFVGGLASSVTESDFKKYFDQFGTITDVVVMYDHSTQRPRGFGFITYDSGEAVDKVLYKTFHELNGKMVEVKRAVPKESSPGPGRNPLGGYNYGLSRVNSFLNGNMQGYTPSNIGGYGIRIDNRFSPVAGGRSGFPLFGSGYGMGMNFDPSLIPGFGTATNYNSNLSYGRGLNPYFIGNSNRFGNPIGYDGNNGGNNSFFSSVTRNLWGNGGLSHETGSASSNSYMGLESGNVGGNAFGNAGVNWGTAANAGQGGRNNSSQNSGDLGYGCGENDYGLVTGAYSRSNGTSNVPEPSYYSSNGGFDGAFSDIYNPSSVYNKPTWRSSNSEQDGSSPFGYGLGSAAADVSAKNSAGYVGGYGVNKRQSNSGIAT